MKKTLKNLNTRINTPKSRNFFKTILKSLNPLAYDDLADRLMKNSFKYLFLFLLVTFIVAVIISIPQISAWPDQVASELDKFTEFRVQVNTTMTDQVNLLPDNPVVRIDTRVRQANMTNERALFSALITNDYLYTKKFFSNKVKATELAPYKDVTQNKEKISSLMTWLLILLIPSLLIFGYVLFAIKYILIMILASVIALIIVRVAQFEISLSSVMKVALHALTPLIIIEILLLPFQINTYYLQYVVYIVFLVLGMIKAGSFVVEKKTRKRSKKGYIELEV